MSRYTVTIKDLQAQATLGVFDWEKTAPRQIIYNVTLEVEAPKAAKSDQIEDTVDYAAIEAALLTHATSQPFQLIEKLATESCDLLLRLDPRIKQVTVEIDKPGALRCAQSVSVRASASQA